MVKALITFALVTLYPGSAWPMVSGNDWLALDEGVRVIYVAGVIEAWLHLWGVTKIPPPEQPTRTTGILSTFGECTNKMTYKQIYAIVEKWMKENPSQWHNNMVGLVGLALARNCP